jgi:hypothetical protein
MRYLLLCGWLILPIGAWAYHEGPGQDGMARDKTAAVLADAHTAAVDKNWFEATDLYDKALALLPKDDVQHARRIRLEWNKARMEASQLPEARQDLDDLVTQLEGDTEHPDAALLAESREALASSQYYMTWLMRLEGLPRDKWEPEIEASRQNYRLLAEASKDPKIAARHQADLESAVKLERLDIEELQGLPLPSQ